jgi:hypothetical protein
MYRFDCSSYFILLTLHTLDVVWKLCCGLGFCSCGLCDFLLFGSGFVHFFCSLPFSIRNDAADELLVGRCRYVVVRAQFDTSQIRQTFPLLKRQGRLEGIVIIGHRQAIQSLVAIAIQIPSCRHRFQSMLLISTAIDPFH